MKIKILGLILTMFLLLAIITQGAIYSPLPINGKVIGSNVGGLQIVITNIRSGKVQAFTTTSAGEFLIDAANFDDNGGTIIKYTIGDQFKIQIAECAGNSLCEDTRTWMGTADPVTNLLEIYTLFEIGDLLGPEPTPECTVDSDCEAGYECIGGDCIEIIEPEPDCLIDSDCDSGYECINEECVEIILPEPTPTPEPEQDIADKVTANNDKTIAAIEAKYGQKIKVIVKNNKLKKLIDKEIRFDHRDYDVHTQIKLEADILTSLNIDGTTNEDYGLNPYMVIREGGMKYEYVFDDKIDLNDIDYDEELEISFLGEDYTIIEASNTKIVVERGELHKNLNIGDTVYFNGKYLKIEHIGLSAGEAYIKVSYNGESTRIVQGDIGEVGDIQVLAYDLIADEDVENLADIKIAEEIEVTIRDGEDYSDEEIWRWIIDMPDYIGIENQEDYVYVDDEDEPRPLTLRDKIELPNGFAVIKFNDITESDTTEIDIKEKEGYLFLRGDKDDSFTYNSEDYKKINIDENGIYDEDLEPLGTKKIKIGDSDIEIEAGSLIIGKLKVLQDMSDILYNGISFKSRDENYLDYLGIIFKDPENAVKESSGFDIIIPDERPEVTITIGAEPKDPDAIPSPIPTPEPVDTNKTEPIEPKETPIPIIEEPKPVPTKPTIEPEPTVPPEPEKDTNWFYTAFISIIAAILGVLGNKYHWIKGFVAMWKKKADSAETAEEKIKAIKSGTKAIKTVLKKDQEGKYKK